MLTVEGIHILYLEINKIFSLSCQPICNSALVGTSGCRHIHREIRKLPTIDGYSKHLLDDGNPRCLSFHRIKKDGQEFALIEVDTSDNKNKLSTLLLKQQDVLFDWERTIRELEIRLLKSSLVWPSKFLKKIFGSGFKRVSHPKSPSESKSLLDQETILRWAERVCGDMD
ncbi:Tn7-like element transposition protein TnsE [Acinetobacter baumannii]